VADERSQTHEVEIAASAEEVWKAVTDPAEIRKYFDEVAELEPRAGGAFRFSTMEGEPARIEVWDPPRRFTVVTPPTPPPGAGATPEAAAQTFEYTIESRGASCVLRLTHSGVPADSSWDDYYDSTNRGWRNVFRTMRYVVEQKLGVDAQKFWNLGGTHLGMEEAWRRALGPDGVLLGLGEHDAGDRFEATTSLGMRWSGTVLSRQEPSSGAGGVMSFVVDELGGAIVALATEPMGGQNMVMASIVTFDPAHEGAAKQYLEAFGNAFEAEQGAG
jgi:uncharacterized protein YndB with AHSA1/START domain